MHRFAHALACKTISGLLSEQIRQHPEESHRLRKFIVLAGRQPLHLILEDDSMAPVFPAGTHIIADPYQGEEAGFVLAIVKDQVLFRKCVRKDDGLRLVALHPGFPPIPVTDDIYLLAIARSARQNLL